MRLSRTMIVLFVLIALATTTVAAPPTTVSYQGRLTTSAGAPVPNGTYSVRFSLWSDATLGTESWSETQMVSVTDGLFSTELGSISGGFFDISVCPPYCDVWLQIEVTIGGGVVTISPRSHLSASPWSLVSRSYYSETSSGLQRGKGVVKGIGGGTNPTQIIVLEGDTDGDGHADYSLNDSVSTSSASRQLGHDSDDDGTLDNTIEQSITPTKTALAIKTKGTSAQRTISSTIYPDSAVQVISSDDDGDGIAQRAHIIRLGSDEAEQLILADSDDDGIPESSDRRTISSNDVHHNVISRGGSTTGTIRMATTPDSAVSVLEHDDNNDGHSNTVLKGIARNGAASYSVLWDFEGDENPENEISQTVTPTKSSLAIKTKGTSAQRQSIALDSESDSAGIVIESDSDGDGIAEARGIVTTKPSSGGTGPKGRVAMSYDSDDDGIDDNTAEMTVTPTKSSLAIKTKGTSAQRQSIALDSEGDSAGLVIEGDADGDGNAEARGIITQKPATANPKGTISTIYDSDDDGTPDNTADMTVTPATSSMAIKTKGTGAQRFSAGGDCDDDDASLHTDCDANNDGTLESLAEMKSTAQSASSILGGMSGSTTGTIRMQATPDSGVLEIGYSGSTTATIRMQASPSITADPIVHSSGAVLTVGGVWTNASDKKLKENFEQVDGAEILEKIEDLSISEWNYKAEGDNARHIGPTAQDFSDAFGLGSSDKTISTIDPSGVALVAIKELTKQNKELKKKNSELENKLNDLQKQIEKLASSMKK